MAPRTFLIVAFLSLSFSLYCGVSAMRALQVQIDARQQRLVQALTNPSHN